MSLVLSADFRPPNWRTHLKRKQHRGELELRDGKTLEKAQEQSLHHRVELFRDQALSCRSGSADSKARDYQRANPREYQIVRAHTKEPLKCRATNQPPGAPCRVTHPDSKETKNTNPIASRQDYHLTQPCSSKEKQTNEQELNKCLTLYNLAKTTGPAIEGQKPKGRKNSILRPVKRRPQTQYVKKKKRKDREILHK